MCYSENIIYLFNENFLRIKINMLICDIFSGIIVVRC